MTPTSPVIQKYRDEEFTLAKGSDVYLPLPVLRIGDPSDGVLLSRWRMTWRERFRALFVGDVFVQVMTFNKPVQPVCVSVQAPTESSEGVAAGSPALA